MRTNSETHTVETWEKMYKHIEYKNRFENIWNMKIDLDTIYIYIYIEL